MKTFKKTICIDDFRNYDKIINISSRAVVYHEGKFLMISSNRGDLIFPGGTIEEFESRLEAAVREVREETGYHFTGEAKYLGEVITRRLDRYDKNKVFESQAHFFTSPVDMKNISEPRLTPKEENLGVKPIWLTKDEIFRHNRAYNQSLSEQDLWVDQVEFVINEFLSLER